MQVVDQTLLEFVAALQRRHNLTSCPTERKEKGHFGTPVEIAAFMAGMFPQLPAGTIRILDPGAGVGTLSAAVCDRIARLKQPRMVTVESWENDAELLPYLWQTMNECREVLKSRGHALSFTIQADDFILARADRRLFGKPRSDRFDLVITNPPYFKLRKESEHARVMSHVVHGQPNIYALFLAASVDLLCDGGHLALQRTFLSRRAAG